MKPIPTDLDILNAICKRYYRDFASGQEEMKVLVPIDTQALAEDLGVEQEIVFGRLYYHLNKKYSYVQRDGTMVLFFCRDSERGYCIQFPLMASVLADLRDKAKRHQGAMRVSIVSIVVAVLALLVSVGSCARAGESDLAMLRRMAAEGGPLDKFIKAMPPADGGKDRKLAWGMSSIDVSSGFSVTPSFSLFVPGPGKLNCEMIVGTRGAKTPRDFYVTIMAAPGQMTFGPELSTAATRRAVRIHQVGVAMGLTEKELGRLAAVAMRVPIARSQAAERSALGFVATLPAKKREAFMRAWPYRSDVVKASRDKVSVPHGPTVGFSLSEKMVVDVMFAPAEMPPRWCTGKYREVGSCWSFIIHGAWATDHSADKTTERAGDYTNLSWPRLSVGEVNSMAADLLRKAGHKQPRPPRR